MPNGRSMKSLAEVAFGASMAGSRAFCAMKHVGMKRGLTPFDDHDANRRRGWSGDRHC